MKKICLLVIFFSLVISAKQPIRYKDKIFTEINKTADIKYGENVDYQNKKIELHFDFYEPKEDTCKTRPCLVFVHGGAFMGENKNEENLVHLCQEFALRGYVTVSIQYRLGTGFSYKEFAEAILRAVQDSKATVRFLRKNKATYGIDDSKFAVGGTSAGGVTAIHYAYMDGPEIPSEVDTTKLGGIEGESGTPGVSSAINCIINCWGAIGDTVFLEDNETIPIASFHGTEDNVVPYDVGFAFNMPFLPLHGSAAIERSCQRLGIPSKLQSYVGMGHEFANPSDPRMDTAITVMIDFLYKHLVDSSPITYVFNNQKKSPDRPTFKIMHMNTKLFGNQIFLSGNQNKSGFLYRLNGKKISFHSFKQSPQAAGIYIID